MILGPDGEEVVSDDEDERQAIDEMLLAGAKIYKCDYCGEKGPAFRPPPKLFNGLRRCARCTAERS